MLMMIRADSQPGDLACGRFNSNWIEYESINKTEARNKTNKLIVRSWGFSLAKTHDKTSKLGMKRMHDGQIICMHGEVGDAHHDTIVKPPLLAVEQHLPGEDHVPGQPPCRSMGHAKSIHPSPSTDQNSDPYIGIFHASFNLEAASRLELS